MTGQVAFEALGALPDELILEAAEKLGFLHEGTPAAAPRRRERSALSRFFGSGWGVALICAVVSVGVLCGVIWAGQRATVDPPLGTVPPIESEQEDRDTDTEASTEESTDTLISRERAKEIASAYWEIRDGDRSPDNGFVFRIECHENPATTSRGETVYVVLLRWFVDGHHWSTVDVIWVDCVTGEVIIPYEDPGVETESENESESDSETETETAAHVHTYSEGEVTRVSTCAKAGELRFVCPCGSVKTEAIPALPHTEVIDPAVPPTVSQSGLKEGKHCSVCGKILVPQSIDPATGHTDLAFEVNEDGRTCTITGMGTCTATDIYVPSSIEGYKVTRIGEIAFIGKPITAIHFPSSVTEIHDGAFHGCTELTEITLPSNITHLGSQAFQACTGLTAATLQCRVTELPHMLFEGCTSLASVTLPSTLTEIRIGAFSNCTALREITFPASLGIIGPGAFQSCTSLTNVTLPAKLGILDDAAFEGCTGLTEMILPDTLNRIGANAFSECSGITAITVPTGVKQAEPSAFERMESLTDIYFRGTEAQWEAAGYEVPEEVRVHFRQ